MTNEVTYQSRPGARGEWSSGSPTPWLCDALGILAEHHHRDAVIMLHPFDDATVIEWRIDPNPPLLRNQVRDVVLVALANRYGADDIADRVCRLLEERAREGRNA